MSALVDSSEHSTVVWCKVCPWWSRTAADEERGYDVAVDHEAEVHPESRAAEINRYKYLRRHESRLLRIVA